MNPSLGLINVRVAENRTERATSRGSGLLDWSIPVTEQGFRPISIGSTSVPHYAPDKNGVAQRVGFAT
jgi:hypothetical protein